jgi:hypothetical protein
MSAPTPPSARASADDPRRRSGPMQPLIPRSESAVALAMETEPVVKVAAPEPVKVRRWPRVRTGPRVTRPGPGDGGVPPAAEGRDPRQRREGSLRARRARCVRRSQQRPLGRPRMARSRHQRGRAEPSVATQGPVTASRSPVRMFQVDTQLGTIELTEARAAVNVHTFRFERVRRELPRPPPRPPRLTPPPHHAGARHERCALARGAAERRHAAGAAGGRWL